jgi:hypothetical protein
LSQAGFCQASCGCDWVFHLHKQLVKRQWQPGHKNGAAGAGDRWQLQAFLHHFSSFSANLAVFILSSSTTPQQPRVSHLCPVTATRTGGATRILHCQSQCHQFSKRMTSRGPPAIDFQPPGSDDVTFWANFAAEFRLKFGDMVWTLFYWSLNRCYSFKC